MRSLNYLTPLFLVFSPAIFALDCPNTGRQSSPGGVYHYFGEDALPNKPKPNCPANDCWEGCAYDVPKMSNTCITSNYGTIAPDDGGYCYIYESKHCTGDPMKVDGNIA
ncbi:hypothetical protein BU23DRAFT_572075 [Bimuria novae-zelandiae CBS 107.79]|uniref:Endo-1,3(4)-beta-glucanase 1 carbohydrate binding domain-containing protein n=1 Tax=Bimuria novae-zelandiae CBS 107.79 TaxID=1447943 RepID=A0A6A5UVW4_9PLEO|nr:hypothetical protein BU23DRAFT_572075 [Bimuria novae-zelandiae CBS 107.79]